jgi:uncharacterized membrane protein
MKTSSLLVRLLASAILLFVFGLSVYRAKVQTIAHDEALTYEWFLDQGAEHVLHYNAANHILQTLIAKPIVKTLGVSEFTLRLPSLLGAAIYLLAIYLLCRQLLGEGLLFLLAFAMLALNPQVLDFMAAARGYSLGLAGLATAMYVLARLADRGEFNVQEREWRWGCTIASVSLALSVAANFTNVVPATCLALSFGVVVLGGASAVLHFRDRRLRDFAKYFLLPGAATGFCILWPYLIQARMAQTAIHLESASVAIRDIFNASFLYRWTDDLLNDLGAVTPVSTSWQARVTELGEYVLMPLLFFLVLLGLALSLRSTANGRVRQKAHSQIFAATAAGTVVLTVILHAVIKVDYPNSRYSLFLVPLFTIGGLLATREIASIYPLRLLKFVGLLISVFIIFVYALSLNAKTFRYNAYDSISRDLYEAIEKDAHARGLTSVRVGGTWWYEPEINFYRLRHRATWMQEYEINDKSYWWQTPNSLTPADYDYFVFVPASDPGLSGPPIRTIFHDDRTRTTIIALSRK